MFARGVIWHRQLRLHCAKLMNTGSGHCADRLVMHDLTMMVPFMVHTMTLGFQTASPSGLTQFFSSSVYFNRTFSALQAVMNVADIASVFFAYSDLLIPPESYAGGFGGRVVARASGGVAR
jgi:hypothetical protein